MGFYFCFAGGLRGSFLVWFWGGFFFVFLIN